MQLSCSTKLNYFPIKSPSAMTRMSHIDTCLNIPPRWNSSFGNNTSFLISDFRRILNVVFFLLVNPRRLDFIRRRFGKLCSIFIGGVSREDFPAYATHEYVTDSVPKRRHIKSRRRGFTQEKEYTIIPIFLQIGCEGEASAVTIFLLYLHFST